MTIITLKHLEPTFRIEFKFPEMVSEQSMFRLMRMIERHGRNRHGYSHFLHIADFTESGIRGLAQELNDTHAFIGAGKLADELLDALDVALADHNPEFEPLSRTVDGRVPVAISHEHPGGTIALWEHRMALAAYAARHPKESTPTMFAYSEFVSLLGTPPKTYLPPEPVRVGPQVPLHEASDEAWADIDAATAHGRDADGYAIVNRVPADAVDQAHS